LLLKSFAENAFFCAVSNCNPGEETRGLEKKMQFSTLESKEIEPLFPFLILFFYMSGFFFELTGI